MSVYCKATWNSKMYSPTEMLYRFTKLQYFKIVLLFTRHHNCRQALATNKRNLRIEFYSQQDGNCCWKRRKCWLPGSSPFPAMFSKDFYLQVVKTKGCLVKG